ncbi:PQQ-binding-like beta-propeller repeat protein [bacterium]|nr:PQQ-binding-like beta-propeller repeat protein [candidate division CSSED10-310 bacterium]
MILRRNSWALIVFFLIVVPALCGDWPNSGGNAGRSGMSPETGPVTEDLLWSGGMTSLIAWQPVIEGSRVFMVRQPAWPGDPDDSFVVAMDLEDGGGGWTIEIPYNSGDWITWVAGVKNGIIYASRAGNGASVSAKLFALEAADGSQIWESDDLIDAGPYDGVVFAPDGDPVIGSFTDIWRIDSADGSTMWHNTRVCSVSGTCGGAIFEDAYYVVDAVYGGHVIRRFDLETGQWLYDSPVMEGFLVQNTPLVGPDGTIYFNRVQNNATVDYFYAFSDNRVEFTQKWRVPAAWGTASEFGIGPDGSVYMVMPGPVLARLHPDDGSVVDSYALGQFNASRMAVDAAGNVFFSNSGFADGHFTVFSPELNVLWDTTVTNINIGGPAIGQNGTLVLCGIGTDVRTYRDDGPTPTPTSETPSVTPTATESVPSVTPTPTDFVPPTETALPTETPYSPSATPAPTETPVQPTNTPVKTWTPSPTPGTRPPSTATSCPTWTLKPTEPPVELGVRIDMPVHVMPGDLFYITGYLDNPGDVLTDIPVFFILDVYGSYWFWDSWVYFEPPNGEIDYGVMDVPNGTMRIEVIPELTWPDTGVGSASGLILWGAMVNPEFTDILGRYAMHTWGYG